MSALLNLAKRTSEDDSLPHLTRAWAQTCADLLEEAEAPEGLQGTKRRHPRLIAVKALRDSGDLSPLSIMAARADAMIDALRAEGYDL